MKAVNFAQWFRLYVIIFFTIIHFLTGNQALKAQNQTIDCTKQVNLLELLGKSHFNPREENEELSRDVYNQFFNLADPKAEFFTNEDLEFLGSYTDVLLEELALGDCSFIEDVVEIYKNRIHYIDSVKSQLLSAPFDYGQKDSIRLAFSDHITYAKNQDDLVRNWYLQLKYSVLSEIFNSEGSPDNVIFTQKEKVARQITEKKETCRLRKLLHPVNGLENMLSDHLANAIALSFDPHTQYFSASEMDAFKSLLSKSVNSYGLLFTMNEKGELEIAHLVPGGSAWKTNQLHVNDIVLEIRTEKGVKADMGCVDIHEIYDFLQSSNEVLIFKVRNTAGVIKEVAVSIGKQESEEAIVKSFILNGDRKIGYISLPGFYTSWEQVDEEGCADDVAREIVKLRKENIEGLILDLRYNGGGSMKEAMSLAGLFIDVGPLCLFRDRSNEVELIKDMNRGTVFDGPLALLVNSSSASASEFLAASLYDNNRAVIVGDTTFGKGTGQVILPVDGQDLMKGGSNGFVKVTAEKFNRISGGSYQKNGVAPHILLPDIYNGIIEKEKDLDHAMEPDSVFKKIYFQRSLELPVEVLSERSRKRIEENEVFENILRMQDSIDVLTEKGLTIELTKDAFMSSEADLGIFEELLLLISSPSTLFTVENHAFDHEILSINPEKKEINNQLLQNIFNDIYINETYQVMEDLIRLTENKE